MQYIFNIKLLFCNFIEYALGLYNESLLKVNCLCFLPTQTQRVVVPAEFISFENSGIPVLVNYYYV